MTRAQLLRSSGSFRAVIADVFFHTMESPSVQPFADNAENSISRTFTSTTYATRAQAGCSKQGFLLSKPLSLPGTRIGRCCAATHTSGRSISTSLASKRRLGVRCRQHDRRSAGGNIGGCVTAEIPTGDLCTCRGCRQIHQPSEGLVARRFRVWT